MVLRTSAFEHVIIGGDFVTAEGKGGTWKNISSVWRVDRAIVDDVSSVRVWSGSPLERVRR